MGFDFQSIVRKRHMRGRSLSLEILKVNEVHKWSLKTDNTLEKGTNMSLLCKQQTLFQAQKYGERDKQTHHKIV